MSTGSIEMWQSLARSLYVDLAKGMLPVHGECERLIWLQVVDQCGSLAGPGGVV
jgi:hypothetical protein